MKTGSPESRTGNPWLQRPSFLVPRPRRLTEAKRAMGTRMKSSAVTMRHHASLHCVTLDKYSPFPTPFPTFISMLEKLCFALSMNFLFNLGTEGEIISFFLIPSKTVRTSCVQSIASNLFLTLYSCDRSS